MNNFASLKILCACSALALAPPAHAQDAAVVDALATVLAAEDAREYNGPLFRSTARHPAALVRSRTALAVGRIGNPAGIRILLEMTTDPDTMVQHDAVFALGLLGDPEALARLRDYVLDARPESPVHDEAVAATMRIGGEHAGALVSDMLNRWVGFSLNATLPTAVRRALKDAWRLGDHAPVRELLQFAVSPDRDVRRSVMYALGRLGAPEAVSVFYSATDDEDPMIRQYAARAFRAALAEAPEVDRRAATRRVERLLDDRDPGVRIEALRTLGTFGGPRHVRAVANQATDPDPGVRVAAVAALANLEGPDAVAALVEQMNSGLFAIERDALLGLARLDTATAAPFLAEWAEDPDWRRRDAAARGYQVVGPSGLGALERLRWDLDPRVMSTALAALLAVGTTGADSIARTYTAHEDEVVRAVAFRHLARNPRDVDLQLFMDGFERARNDRGAGVRTAIIRSLGRLAERGRSDAVGRAFLRRFPSSTDPRDRAAAHAAFPMVAESWGPLHPVVTARTIDDYRDLVRETLLPALQGEMPQMIVETDRGTITVDLLPHVAPLTVQAFSELIDRRYFDGGAWHRVVPNFVIQDGDPRGDGRGSPGFTLRDEVSRLRYETGTVGLARSTNFDTGSSQYFITLSPQPHLEGAYTIFGTVREGEDVLNRVTQGDRIRRVRRIEQRQTSLPRRRK